VGDVAKRRKVGNLLALMVLATLVERPSHPYELASLLRVRGKDQDINIKWGSLYTVVQNLEKHGLIEATASERQGRRPERTVYAITSAGRAELTDWVRELIRVPEREPTRFQAALSVVGVLGPDEAIDLLAERSATLDAQVEAYRASLAEWGKELPRMFLVEAEYELALRSAEAGWLRGFVGELRDGSFPGLAEWRLFHETGQLPPELAELSERGRVTD
jgi:DNA-binding PadR family transcriptional regulator